MLSLHAALPVCAGLLLPPAYQPAVLVRTGEDVVDQLLVVEDPELPPFIEPTGITRRAQRSPDPRQRREHFATVGGADLTVGSIVHGLPARNHPGLEFRPDERRLGKECGSTGRFGWSPFQ